MAHPPASGQRWAILCLMNTSSVKPGISTTEFWTTLFVHLVTTASLLAALFGKQFDGNKLQPLIPAVAMLASAIAQGFYSHSRAVVKSAALYSPPVQSGE